MTVYSANNNTDYTDSPYSLLESYLKKYSLRTLVLRLCTSHKASTISCFFPALYVQYHLMTIWLVW